MKLIKGNSWWGCTQYQIDVAWLGHFTCHLGGIAYGVEFGDQHMKKWRNNWFSLWVPLLGMSRFPPAASHPTQQYHQPATFSGGIIKMLKLALTTVTVAGFTVAFWGRLMVLWSVWMEVHRGRWGLVPGREGSSGRAVFSCSQPWSLLRCTLLFSHLLDSNPP